MPPRGPAVVRGGVASLKWLQVQELILPAMLVVGVVRTQNQKPGCWVKQASEVGPDFDWVFAGNLTSASGRCVSQDWLHKTCSSSIH